MEVKSGSIEEKIIIASFQIIEKEGISGATTKKIATQAEVSEVTLFRKFKNKQNIIEVAKEYFYNHLIEKLNEIFEFTPEISVEEYLTDCFYELVNLTDTELNIFKIGMEEVRNIPSENKLFLKISETIMEKLKNFFTLKIQRNEMRKINPDIMALTIFGILFESIILWKVYGKTPKYPLDKYIEDFLDIFLNGTKSDIQ